ncbi:MAG: hypothetical protein K2L82_09860 [Lachnospiraceae bacterium]|nr:hypothetical protein [Lachnospiraceae bacterium]
MCKKRVISLLLAGLLVTAPVMDVLAKEATEGGRTAESTEDDKAKEDAGEDDDGIISVEDANEMLDAYDNEETEWEEIYIDSVDDLQKFSRDCWLDTWSQNKKVYLTKDIDLAGSGFESVPTFGGYFDGQGYTISGLSIKDSVSYTGLFCYTQKSAVIANLNVEGVVHPGGDQMVVGGIVGDNSGIIIHCTFDGTVEGIDYVGGVVGFNEQSGIIMDCTNSGKVLGTHYTGGIAGENVGNIVGCGNEAEINTSNEDKPMSLEDINIAQYVGLIDTVEGDEESNKEAAVVNNTIDSGGIAGLSTGIIQFCNNSGKIGYEHVGYNTGGIVGRQSGYVYACENTGAVYGRKDVGGIAGQTEPYIAVDLSQDIAYQLTENIDKMHDLTGQMLNDAGSESDTLSARLTVVQDFVDKALEDTSFLADRTVGWTDEMIGSVNEAVNRLDYVMDETAKDNGVIDHTKDAAGNVKDAAGKLEDTVDSLDIYRYMSPQERELYDNAKANMESATQKYSEDYAKAVAAQDDYWIAHYAFKESEFTDGSPNETDLKPIRNGIVDTSWDGTANESLKPWESYIDCDGWVHHSDDNGDSEFPQPGGTPQGDLDQRLLNKVAEEMYNQSGTVANNASEYAKDEYKKANTGSAGYEADMRNYLEIMSEIVMSVQGEMTQEAAGQLRGAVGYVKDASEHLESAGAQTKNIFDTLNGMPDIALPQLGDDYRSKTNSLTANLQGLSENMGYLNNEMSTTNDVLIGDLEDINDQFRTIMRLYTDAIDGVLDMDYTKTYEDTSQEDAETSSDATIADCRNNGTVQGDINVSGIAGTMAIEYDFDLEGDVTGIEDARMNSTFLTKCVLRRNINLGKVTAQKSCAGGISGLQEMGTILLCENYGRINSSAGNYVGGVAGQSLSNIVSSYAKCTVSGEKYVAGIAGSGSGIQECCAIVRIQDASAFSGAIAGEVDGSKEVKGNYFVSEEIAGIDRISYSGKAEPISYEEMLRVEGIPNKFRMMTISFYADETEVKTVQCPYRGSVPMELYPEIPAKEGFYADWDIKDLSSVLYDEDVTVEYVRYLTTLASAQTRSNAQSAILVDGMFRQEDVLSVEGNISETEANNAKDNAGNNTDYDDAGTSPDNPTEHWAVEIPDDGYASHQIRYQAPDGQTEGVDIYVKKDGVWVQADTELMGIYHLFTVEGTEAEIAVCVHEKSITDYLIYIIPAAVGVLVVVILLIRKGRKKRKTRKAAGTMENGESVEDIGEKKM